TTPCPPLTPKPTAGPTPAPTGEPTTTPCPPLTPKPTAGPTPAPCPPLTPKPTAYRWSHSGAYVGSRHHQAYSGPYLGPCDYHHHHHDPQAYHHDPQAHHHQAQQVVDGIDYFGHDITSTKRANYNDCCDDCDKTPGCVVYVWTPWEDGTCFLKYKADKTRSYWGAKAAQLPYNGPTCDDQEQDVDYYGNDLVELPGAVEDCCALCLTRD
ncbi:hypothetical protein As57867_024652, partial [Aphanomyces stellatus]